jgi:hypothetical protein
MGTRRYHMLHGRGFLPRLLYLIIYGRSLGTTSRLPNGLWILDRRRNHPMRLPECGHAHRWAANCWDLCGHLHTACAYLPGRDFSKGNRSTCIMFNVLLAHLTCVTIGNPWPYHCLRANGPCHWRRDSILHPIRDLIHPLYSFLPHPVGHPDGPRLHYDYWGAILSQVAPLACFERSMG